jgi:hypothetical protein
VTTQVDTRRSENMLGRRLHVKEDGVHVRNTFHTRVPPKQFSIRPIVLSPCYLKTRSN